MSTVRYSLGIDPGWKNLGVALVKEEGGILSLVKSATVNPSSFPVSEVTHAIAKSVIEDRFGEIDLSFLTMERYVSYQNVMTAESENILMLIGALREYSSLFFEPSCDIILTRAIDWKTELVKLLFKNKGFNNPSTSLDKKFSIAAAHACLDVPGTFNTDHEADAICLACLPLLRERYRPKPKQAVAV